MLRDTRVRAVVWVLIGVLLAAIVAFLLSAAALTAQIRKTQLEGTPVGQKLVSSADRILDCTDPKGECYKQSQNRTARAVQDISAGNILAVVCALQVPNGTPLDKALEQVTDCVAKRLARP